MARPRPRSNRRLRPARAPGWLLRSLRDGLAGGARRAARPLAALAASALVCAAVAAGARAVYRAPHFSVREIRVDGARRLKVEAVRRRLGVALGAPLFGVDLRAASAQVAELPWVAAAEARRELPSTLVVALREREPAALALLGALYLIDRDGVPFKRAGLDESAGLPVITGVRRELFRDDRRQAEALLRQGLAALAAYGEVAGRPRVAEVHVDEEHGVSFFTHDGATELRLGRGPLGARLARFDRVWGALGPSAPPRVIYLDDDRWTDRVVIRPASGAGALAASEVALPPLDARLEAQPR